MKESFFTLTLQQLMKESPQMYAIQKSGIELGIAVVLINSIVSCSLFLFEAIKDNPESMVVAKGVLASLEKYINKDVYAGLMLALIGAEQAVKSKKDDPYMVSYEDLVGLEDAKKVLRWVISLFFKYL